MNSDFYIFWGYIVTTISTIPPDRDRLIKCMEVCHRIIADIEEFNSILIKHVLDADRPKAITEFAEAYSIRVEDSSTFKFTGYSVPWLRGKRSDTID